MGDRVLKRERRQVKVIGRLSPRRGISHDPRRRNATRNREWGVRSRYRRCPSCKKLRLYWLDPNWVRGDHLSNRNLPKTAVNNQKNRERWDHTGHEHKNYERMGWQKLNGILACHICVMRRG